MAYGDISTIIDTYEFNTTRALTPEMIHISGNVYAIVYDAIATDLILITVEISDSGQITEPYIDILVVHDLINLRPCIINVTGNIYAIPARNAVWQSILTTVEIADNGQISDSILDSCGIDTVNATRHAMANITSSIVILAYTSESFNGSLKTYRISAGGLITDPFIDELVYDTGGKLVNRILEIDGNVFAITYQNADDHGWLKTFSVGSDGFISAAPIDGLEFTTSFGGDPTICHITGTIYAIAYKDSAEDGQLLTVSISSDGTINPSVIDTLEYDTETGREPSMIHIGQGIIAIAYGTGWNHGFFQTFQISSQGDITDTPIDTYEFDASYCSAPSLIHIAGNIYAVAYRGPDEDGFLITMAIETPLFSKPHHEMFTGIGP